MLTRHRTRTACLAVLVAATAVLVGGPVSTMVAAQAAVGSPGAAGIGDPYFPYLGNGGYGVSSYHLDLSYAARHHSIRGRATITASATQDLSRFDLDLLGLTVTGVTVDGKSATFVRHRSELVVTPSSTLTNGSPFTTVVAYHGSPQRRSSPSLGSYGWFDTRTGAVIVGEPIGAELWYPCNDHPADKARFSLTMKVPHGLQVVSNGLLTAPPATSAGKTTFAWASTHPMPTYATTVAIGHFRIHRYRTAGNVPVYDAVETVMPHRVDRALHDAADAINYFERRFGSYPLEAACGIAMNTNAGFALETQTRPVYSRPFFRRGTDAGWAVAHELAHQWYGDSVALSRWRDVWLNEGFATYLEWMWSSHHTGTRLGVLIRQQYRTPAANPFWRLKIGDPGPAHLFDWPVYSRGALTLQALRLTVGDHDFFRIMRQWAVQHADGNATTPQFKALAESVSGRQLDGLFHRWLQTSRKPALP
jgi:aminopeptidase N